MKIKGLVFESMILVSLLYQVARIISLQNFPVLGPVAEFLLQNLVLISRALFVGGVVLLVISYFLLGGLADYAVGLLVAGVVMDNLDIMFGMHGEEEGVFSWIKDLIRDITPFGSFIPGLSHLKKTFYDWLFKTQNGFFEAFYCTTFLLTRNLICLYGLLLTLPELYVDKLGSIIMGAVVLSFATAVLYGTGRVRFLDLIIFWYFVAAFTKLGINFIEQTGLRLPVTRAFFPERERTPLPGPPAGVLFSLDKLFSLIDVAFDPLLLLVLLLTKLILFGDTKYFRLGVMVFVFNILMQVPYGSVRWAFFLLTWIVMPFFADRLLGTGNISVLGADVFDLATLTYRQARGIIATTAAAHAQLEDIRKRKGEISSQLASLEAEKDAAWEEYKRSLLEAEVTGSRKAARKAERARRKWRSLLKRSLYLKERLEDLTKAEEELKAKVLIEEKIPKKAITSFIKRIRGKE